MNQFERDFADVVNELTEDKPLAIFIAMELPAEVVAMLEQELSREIARVVEERIAPLERMVR